jgi:hypothetical protein
MVFLVSNLKTPNLSGEEQQEYSIIEQSAACNIINDIMSISKKIEAGNGAAFRRVQY